MTLLCERCGYPLGGLDISSRCSECGEPVVASLPSTRPGSAWQRGLPGAWRRTAVHVLFRPRSTMRSIRIERKRSGALLRVSTLAAATAGVSPVAVIAVVDTAGYTISLSTLVLYLAFLFLVWLVLLAASWIECVGIRVLGRRRGWRITPEVAAAVCGHAAPAWVVGGVLCGIASGLSAILIISVGKVGIAVSFALASTGLAALVGLLWFEILVYLGVRSCRFANVAGSERELTPRDDTDEALTAPPAIASFSPPDAGGTHNADAHSPERSVEQRGQERGAIGGVGDAG